ncbi:MAG: membrane integrity-associated transporter subunit PqiC [Chromatiaceae bacterium]|nr:membrane integrity-associated transporter subunit PqiC [Chromatiaceae bacterium]
MRGLGVFKIGLPLAGLAWLAGCASSPASNFYILSPLPEAKARQETLVEGEVSLGIGPVTLPDYMDRPQMVSGIVGAGRIEVDEYQRWGGSLRADIVNTLGENLAHLLGTSRVVILPAEVKLPVQYRLVVDILRFEADSDGQALLKARWALIDPSAEVALAMRESSFRQPFAKAGPDAQVAALSATLGDLSREVAETIRRLP